MKISKYHCSIRRIKLMFYEENNKEVSNNKWNSVMELEDRHKPSEKGKIGRKYPS